MVTRSKIGVKRPKRVFIDDVSRIEPINIANALYQKEWKHVMLGYVPSLDQVAYIFTKPPLLSVL